MKYHILTPFQQRIFEVLAQNSFVKHHFRFVGGTALSEFYLQHRLSEDLDFFTNEALDLSQLRDLLHPSFVKIGADSLEYRQFASAKIFFLRKGQREIVKTEFSQFPYPPIDQPLVCLGLRIDSLLDITLSKLDAILNRQKARDFVDYYFIQKEQKYPLKHLLEKLEQKIQWRVDPLLLASRFHLAGKLKDYPKMILPLNGQEMIAYFHNLADSLKPAIFK